MDDAALARMAKSVRRQNWEYRAERMLDGELIAQLKDSGESGDCTEQESALMVEAARRLEGFGQAIDRIGATIVDWHFKIEDREAVSWGCIKCGFRVLPEHKGHRCMGRGEMYTKKPLEPKTGKVKA